MSVKKEYYSFVIKERTLRRKLERKKLRFEKIERVYLELLEKQEEIKKVLCTDYNESFRNN